jgi:hypothetical protein
LEGWAFVNGRLVVGFSDCRAYYLSGFLFAVTLKAGLDVRGTILLCKYWFEFWAYIVEVCWIRRKFRVWPKRYESSDRIS